MQNRDEILLTKQMYRMRTCSCQMSFEKVNPPRPRLESLEYDETWSIHQFSCCKACSGCQDRGLIPTLSFWK